MPNPTQPGVLPIWTQGNTGVRTQPSNGEQFAGFVPDFRPPSSWHNWLFGIFSDWIAWLNFITSPSNFIVVSAAAVTLQYPNQAYLGDSTLGSYNATCPAPTTIGFLCAVKNRGSANVINIIVPSGAYLEGTLNGSVAVGPGECVTIAGDGVTGFWQIN